MGSALFPSIEKEEKKLRMSEDRAEIIDLINSIEDPKSEEGQQDLKFYTELFEKTFSPDEESEDEEGGVSDVNVINTKLPWEDLENPEDKQALEKQCRIIAK